MLVKKVDRSMLKDLETAFSKTNLKHLRFPQNKDYLVFLSHQYVFVVNKNMKLEDVYYLRYGGETK